MPVRNAKKNKIRASNYGILPGHISVSLPFQKLQIDLYGPIETSEYIIDDETPKVMILSIIDVFTKFISLTVIKDSTAITVCKNLLEHWIYLYPIPEIIVTDQGKCFMGCAFKEVCDKFEIKHKPVLSYTPTANAMVERIHQDLGARLRMYKGKDLVHAVSKIASSHNSTYHSAIGMTPTEVVFKTKKYNVYSHLNPVKLIHDIKERIISKQNQSIQRRNKNRKEKDFINKRVYVKLQNPKKLDERWKGPYLVIQDDKEKGTIQIQKKGSKEWLTNDKVKIVGGEAGA